MLKRFLISLLCSLLYSVLRAHAAPGWTEEIPKDDSEYRYYVGRSAPAPSEAQAFREAMKDATEQAVRGAFGMVASVSSEAYQTERETRGTVRLFERSKEVRVEGFSRVRQHIERRDSGTVVWVLCRYERAAIEREKARLARIGTEDSKDPEWSIVGGVAAENQTRLEMTTEPAGARVIIAGEVFGKTPILIRGQLPAGPVQVQVDHPSYETRSFDVVLSPGETREVRAALVRARGMLDVESSPEGAKVEINGVDYGTTPLAGLRLAAGETYEIRLSHGSAEPVSQGVTIERNVSRRFEVRLPLRPAQLAYKFEPADAVVTVDGKTAKTLASMHLAPGPHRIRAEREGYVLYQKDLSLEPGQTTDLGEIRMTTISDEEKRRERSPWILGLDGGVNQSPLPGIDHRGVGLGISFEKRFLRRITFGVRAGMAYHFGGFDDYSQYYTHETTTWEVGVHGMVRVFSGLHVLAERGILRGTYRYRPEDRTGGSDPVESTRFATDYSGHGLAWEFSSARIMGVMRKYSGTGGSAGLLRLSLFTKW